MYFRFLFIIQHINYAINIFNTLEYSLLFKACIRKLLFEQRGKVSNEIILNLLHEWGEYYLVQHRAINKTSCTSGRYYIFLVVKITGKSVFWV
jgi:hypothetical protein